MPWPEKYTDDIPSRLPGLFADGASITSVCVKLGINRDTYYDWQQRHPEFAEAAKQGQLISQQWWESRGAQGIFGEIDKFAGSSWQFVMKNRFRDDYADEKKDNIQESLIEKLLAKL